MVTRVIRQHVSTTTIKKKEESNTTSDLTDDIVPLVLTSATQELFGCRADVDVNLENPYKLLQKEVIVQDIKTRAAVSDFSPVRQIVQDYTEDELLLVFDRNFTYGQNFYLVITPAAKTRMLSAPKPTTPVPVLNAMTPDSKQWISLGSEHEIEEESGGESREKLLFKCSRVRRKFGMLVCFSDRNSSDATDGFMECASYQDNRFSVKRLQRDCGVQAVPRILSSTAQTEWKFLKNNATQYTAREISGEDKENLLHSENLKEFCKVVTPRILLALQQEEIMNVFVDDWMALGTGAQTVDNFGKVNRDLMIYQVFNVHSFIPEKKISCINWHPTIQGVIAVALTDNMEEQFNESKPPVILLYEFSDPSKPQLLLECPDGILAFEFCPSDPNILVGGCVNGQVVLWDISSHVTHLQCKQPAGQKTSINSDTYGLDEPREKKTPLVPHCAGSALENSHKAPVTDVCWLPRTLEVTRGGIPMENQLNICVQLVTCSSDCSLLFWDVRASKPVLVDKTMTLNSVPDTFKHLDRTWKPLFKVSLPKIKKAGEYAPLKFSLDHYTCTDKSGSSPEASHNHGSEVPVYNRLRMPSAKTLTPLEDVNTKMYIGTEDGEIVYTDWKLEKDDGGRLRSTKPQLCYNVHHYSVNTVQRSPFLKDVVLTGSSWNFAIWQEGVVDGPVFLSPTSEQQCTVACWSPSRAAVFYIGRADGNIEVWNLLEKSSEPVQVYAHHTDSKITSIKPWTVSTKQHLLAVADDHGMVRVFEIPRKHCIPTRNEIKTLKKFLQLEEEKLKDFLKRGHVWSEEKKATEDQKKKTEQEDPSKVLHESPEENKDYKEFLLLEEKILKSTGLLPTIATSPQI